MKATNEQWLDNLLGATPHAWVWVDEGHTYYVKKRDDGTPYFVCEHKAYIDLAKIVRKRWLQGHVQLLNPRP